MDLDHLLGRMSRHYVLRVDKGENLSNYDDKAVLH